MKCYHPSSLSCLCALRMCPTMKFYTKKILITCFGLLLRHRETKDRKTFICSPISEPGGKGEHEDKGNYMTVVN